MSTTVLVSPHSPTRPEWTCVFCGLPYPCPQGRYALAGEFGPGGRLGERMSAMLHEAVADGLDAPLWVLWERFVAWTAPAPAPGLVLRVVR